LTSSFVKIFNQILHVCFFFFSPNAGAKLTFSFPTDKENGSAVSFTILMACGEAYSFVVSWQVALMIPQICVLKIFHSIS